MGYRCFCDEHHNYRSRAGFLPTQRKPCCEGAFTPDCPPQPLTIGVCPVIELEPYLPYLHWLLVALGLVVSISCAVHALFSKKDPRSAAAWIAVCLMWPLVGAIIYLLFGKNRIKTRARLLHGTAEIAHRGRARQEGAVKCSDAILPHYVGLSNLSAVTTQRPLVEGNYIELLVNGEEAYPRMLEAIDNARTSVYLASYIFDSRGIGQRFIDSLAAARARGVEVRVLIDGVGRLYSWPRADRKLRKAGVPVARYLPPSLLPPRFTVNLRNHRKILVVDGSLAFTGGMNIRNDHLVQSGKSRHRAEDIHFLVDGPIVAQLQKVLVNDWRFSSSLFINPPTPAFGVRGGACCRVISDGPNDDMDNLLRIMIGAIGVARQSISIMTPYFLPERELEMALQLAALRGVRVRIILPGSNNMPFVNWAAFHMLRDMMDSGVEFYLYNGVFVHSKLFVVDDYYTQIGSSNLDPRSLKLNFEVAVEYYSEASTAPLVDYFEHKLDSSRLLEQDKLTRRSPVKRFVGAFFWLLSPWL